MRNSNVVFHDGECKWIGKRIGEAGVISLKIVLHENVEFGKAIFG
jgi:hypothetical protein